MQAKINWPGFMFHGRTCEVGEPYMWTLRGEDMAMVRDCDCGGNVFSLALDKLRVLT